MLDLERSNDGVAGRRGATTIDQDPGVVPFPPGEGWRTGPGNPQIAALSRSIARISNSRRRAACAKCVPACVCPPPGLDEAWRYGFRLQSYSKIPRYEWLRSRFPCRLSPRGSPGRSHASWRWIAGSLSFGPATQATVETRLSGTREGQDVACRLRECEWPRDCAECGLCFGSTRKQAMLTRASSLIGEE